MMKVCVQLFNDCFVYSYLICIIFLCFNCFSNTYQLFLLVINPELVCLQLGCSPKLLCLGCASVVLLLWVYFDSVIFMLCLCYASVMIMLCWCNCLLMLLLCFHWSENLTQVFLNHTLSTWSYRWIRNKIITHRGDVLLQKATMNLKFPIVLSIRTWLRAVKNLGMSW